MTASLSILDAVYSFYPGGLTPPQAEALREIPGVKVKDRRVLSIVSPYNVAWLVEDTLNAWGVGYGSRGPADLVLPRPWEGEESISELQERILDAPGLRDWTVTGEGGLGWSTLDFQYEAMWFLLEHGGGLLKEAPGSGKTWQSVAFAALDEEEGPTLIVTKKDVMTQFGRALTQFTVSEALELRPPSQAPTRKTGESEWVENEDEEGGGSWVELREAIDALEQMEVYFARCREQGVRPYVITSWGALRIHVDTLLAVPWRTVIFDEIHLGRAPRRLSWVKRRDDSWNSTYLDNQSAAAWRLAMVTPRRLGMSATPVFDRRSDLYGVITLVQPRGWGKPNGSSFMKRYCGAGPGEFGGLDTSGVSNTEELQARMSFCFHNVPKSVSHAQLPPVHVITRFVGPMEQDRVTGFVSEMKRLARQAARGSESATSKLQELARQEAAARKRTATISAVAEYVAGSGASGEGKGKVIVFTGRHRDCWDLTERLKKKLGGVDVWPGIERGAEKDKSGKWTYTLASKQRRQDIQDAYMDHPGPCVIVATGYAWGTGLDLQDTDALIINMLPWSPGDFDQWRGRIERLGMTRACVVLIMIAAGTSDERGVVIFSDKAPDIIDLMDQESLAGVRDSILGLDDIEALLDSIERKVASGGMDGLSELDWEELGR